MQHVDSEQMVESSNFLSRDGAHNRALISKMIFAKILDQAMYIVAIELALAKQS
jgi:hypothetical protein